MSRVERLAPWVAGAVIASPVLLAHYPPMSDLPFHEAVVGLLRHWGDPAYIPANVYELNFGQPNQLFYFLILPLAYVLPIGTATKLVVALALFFLPPAAARLADYLGVTRWTAVLVAPLGLGWMFFWGLLANLIGFVLYLAALPTFDRACAKPTARTVGAACAWMVLLHFAHDAMALIAGGTVALFTLLAWRGARENATRLAPTAVVLVLAVGSRMLDARELTKHAQTLATVTWYPLGHKLTSIPAVLYGGYDGWVRDLIWLVCTAPMVLFAIERWRARTPAVLPWRERVYYYRFELLSGALIVAYFAAPVNLRSTTLIYHRFLPPAWAVLTITLARRADQSGGDPWRLPRLLAAITPLVPILTSWPRFLDADRAYRDLDAAIDRMDKNSTYIVLELGSTDGSLLFNPATGGGHIVARLGGRGFYDFTDSPASPVMLRREVEWTHIFERLDAHAYRLYPSYDLTHFRYAVLHTTDGSIASVVVRALAPDAKVLVHVGEWTVMESNLPQVPADSPDEAVPMPHPPTLRKRALQVMNAMSGSPPDDEALPAP